MESLLFALQAVLPIIFMVALGYLLKKTGLAPVELAKPLNKLVFRVFLPAMLFLNVYKIENLGEIQVGYLFYVIAVVVLVFACGIPLVMLVTKKGERRGALLQATFRSNYALIGLPLAESLCGEQGIAVASLLSAVAIPLFNVLAVLSLSIFQRGDRKAEGKKIVLDILKNPLILGLNT